MTSSTIVYTDLDGTMVGPGGCFFRDIDRAVTLEPAQALVDLLDEGITIVLVSGRTRAQLLEACHLLGADGFIGELGSVIGWDRGMTYEVLRGEMPPHYDGTPVEVLTDEGVVGALLDRYPGRLELYSPWHVGHEGDVMMRGLLDPLAAEAWLADTGFPWLRLHDNGVLPQTTSTTLHPEALPPHVYHLMPAGLSKGTAVARDLARRGLTTTDAIAIGDSASDLTMAPHVRRMFVVANGHRLPHMGPLLDAVPNVTRTDGPVGAGWAEAARAALHGDG